MIKNNTFSFKKLIIPIIALIVMLIGAFCYPYSNTLTVQTIYGDVMNGSGSRILWNDGSSFDISKSKFGNEADFGSTVVLKHGIDSLVSIAVAPTDIEEICTIRSINIAADEADNTQISASMIDGYFVAENAAGFYDEQTDMYYFLPTGENAYLVMNEDAYKGIVNPVIDADNLNELRKRIAICILTIITLSLIVFNYSKLEKYFDELFDSKNGYFEAIAAIAFILALFTVVLIAFRSNLGGLHPDEEDVFECLKYGMTHLIPPDIRDENVGVTFSGYGYTKLANGTYYFLIAGKIAAIAKFFYAAGNWARIPNVILFLAMGYIYLKNIKKKNFLVLVLGVSVQAFYIFSYVTADALDFFFSFLVILQLTDEESMLNKLIEEGINKKNLYKAILLGVLFGMVMIGKQNYWAILLLAFAVLLIKLIKASKEDKSKYWKVFGAIILFFVVTVGTRYAFDFAHYGFNGSEIKHEYDIKYASYDKNPETPKQDMCPTYRMHEQGYELPDLFMEYPTWFKETFHTFCGLIGDKETPQTYYTLMGFLYLFVIATLIGTNLKEGVLIERKIEAVVCMGILLLSIVVSIFNSYISDAQAQGRYLLPMVMVLGYLGYRTPEAFEKKYFRVALLLINILCVWCFATSSMKLFEIKTW